MNDENIKLSPLEELKDKSNYLRGRFKELLADDSTHMPKEEIQLLKFHGSYQQDDRDLRSQLIKEKKEKAFSFMIRTRHAAGLVTPEQYLAFDNLSNNVGNKTMRMTTRQTFQFHGVLKKDLKTLIRTVNESLSTTSGTCGDIVRNVTGDPAPFESRKKIKLQEYCQALSDQFLSQSGAYYDVWLEGSKVEAPEILKEGPEPIYGKTYLPRKFKIAMVYPDVNSVDVLTNDIGIAAEVDADENLSGFNIFVGGGFGMSLTNPDTYPRLATPLCFVKPDELLDVTKAIVLVQKENGNRSDRKQARLKYLIDKKGMDWFRQETEKKFGKKLESAHEVTFKDVDLYLGWHEEGDGKWFFGLSVENGRVKDEGDFRLKTALRTVVEKYKPTLFLTAQQDVLLSGFTEDQKKDVEEIFTSHGILLPEQISNVRKDSMACPAFPTCGLAFSESERVLPDLTTELAGKLKELGLDQNRIMIRMTGCPNGCARPYNSEIAFVGRTPGTYTFYIGGSLRGDRLNFVLKDKVPYAELIPTLLPILSSYKENKSEDESFGDYCARMGKDSLLSLVEK